MSIAISDYLREQQLIVQRKELERLGFTFQGFTRCKSDLGCYYHFELETHAFTVDGRAWTREGRVYPNDFRFIDSQSLGLSVAA